MEHIKHVLLAYMIMPSCIFGMEQNQKSIWQLPKKLPQTLEDRLTTAKLTGRIDLITNNIDATSAFDGKTLGKEIALILHAYSVKLGGLLVHIDEPSDLRSITKSIATLPHLRNLEISNLVSDCLAHERVQKTQLVADMIKRATKLTTVNLSHSQLCVPLFQALAGKRITSLNLSHIGIGEKGPTLTELKKLLPTMRTLEELDLSDNGLYTLSANDWHELFRTRTIKKLNLSNNLLCTSHRWRQNPYMGREPYAPIAVYQALDCELEKSQIEELDLSNNFSNSMPMDEPACAILADAFSRMPCLKKLYLNWSDCHSNIIKLIMRGLLYNHNRPILVVQKGQHSATFLPENFISDIFSPEKDIILK